MKASRVTAVGLVAAAGLWIASGHLFPHQSGVENVSAREAATERKKLFRVAVERVRMTEHASKLVLSGRTEADKRVTLTARTGGVLTDLRIRRGSRVKAGEILAVLSDDARQAQVAQMRSLLVQRETELDAKRRLISSGVVPKLELVNLEAQVKVAQASLAVAEAELERGFVRAPWDGIVQDTSVEVGGAAFSFNGREIATIVALDPMLAVVEVSERRLAGTKVGDRAEVKLVTGQKASGTVQFVAKTASANTRTYRVEVEIANPDGSIPDGITAEVSLPVEAVTASRIPRSALTIASTGDIGVRLVADGIVRFAPVKVAEDEQSFMWVTGIPDNAQVIVQGQDFVREGQQVEVVLAADVSAAAK